MAVIDVDYTTPVETLLDHAEDRLHGATMNAADSDLTPAAEALRSLGHAIGSLDQLMGFVDGIVDVGAYFNLGITTADARPLDSSDCESRLDAAFFRLQGMHFRRQQPWLYSHLFKPGRSSADRAR